MRYNDVFNNTNVIDEVLPKYKAAWAKRGMVAENGLFRQHYAPKRDTVFNNDEISHSGWYVVGKKSFVRNFLLTHQNLLGYQHFWFGTPI